LDAGCISCKTKLVSKPECFGDGVLSQMSLLFWTLSTTFSFLKRLNSEAVSVSIIT
jgi:hypothetical protein